MLTDKDITKIIEAMKQIFYTKDEVVSKEEFHESFTKLQTSVDNFAKKINDHDIELKAINHRIDQLENPA